MYLFLAGFFGEFSVVAHALLLLVQRLLTLGCVWQQPAVHVKNQALRTSFIQHLGRGLFFFFSYMNNWGEGVGLTFTA